jgi:hypothetical protein
MALGGGLVPPDPEMLGGIVVGVTAGAGVDVELDGDVVADAGTVVVGLPSVGGAVVGGVVPVVTGDAVVVVTGGRVVVVTGGSVVVVTVGSVVVVTGPPPATAITGAMGAAVGVEVVTPEGVTESLGYAVQVRARGAPDTIRDKLAEEPSWIVTSGLDAVNPLTVAGVEGTDRGTPPAGIGLGRGALKDVGPSGVVAGVAPLASIWVVAVPASG